FGKKSNQKTFKIRLIHSPAEGGGMNQPWINFSRVLGGIRGASFSRSDHFVAAYNQFYLKKVKNTFVSIEVTY
ncbi:hypothetical protein KAS50_03685, partial [bacterium]|nr:hypothetical protein [bacterium]